jgi:chorismate mutase
MSDEELRPLRDEIDAVDRRIVSAFNERLALVERLWRLKEAHGAPRVDAGREREILDLLREANTGPLSDDGLQELVTEVLALTKREQARGA